MASFESANGKVNCPEKIGLTTDTYGTAIVRVIKSSNAPTGVVVSCMRRTANTIVINVINMRKYAQSRGTVHRGRRCHCCRYACCTDSITQDDAGLAIRARSASGTASGARIACLQNTTHHFRPCSTISIYPPTSLRRSRWPLSSCMTPALCMATCAGQM